MMDAARGFYGTSVVFRGLVTLCASLGLAGCLASSEHAEQAQARTQTRELPECAQSEHDAIRLKLLPHCGSCHGPGSSAPYFASAEAFESLVVRDPRWVKPGDPEASGLILLLEGRGTGTFKQMPTAGPPYAQLSDPSLSMGELRAWIKTLKLSPLDRSPAVDLPTTRRLGASEIQGALLAQLGLSFEDDFVQTLSSSHDSVTLVLQGPMPLYSPTQTPGLHYVASRTSTSQRWAALGGADWLERQVSRYDISPSFLQTMTQLSQAWCELAVKKGDAEVLFAHVQPTAKSAEAAEAIQENIRAMHLRMLALPARADEIKAIYEQVFLAHEPQGPQVAWVAVCSYFIRHPLWLSL